MALGGDPYQSMYSQAFGPRQASQKSLTLERHMQRQVRTPQKSASVQRHAGRNQTAQRSNRQRGHSSMAETQNTFMVHNTTIGGYTGGRKTRVTDKFVRYPYPKTLGSGYQKDFKDKLKSTIVLKNGESFNLEKEAKIINPHPMELATTNAETFKSFDVKPKQKVYRKYTDDGKPILAQSSYMKSFPNW